MEPEISETATAAAASEHPEDWCISIKTVGGGFDDDESTAAAANKNSKISSSGERLFSVTVSPEDGVASLYQEIAGATGVKPSQQRLIYRGRIINDHPPVTEAEGDGDESQTTPKSISGNNNNYSSGDVEARVSASPVLATTAAGAPDSAAEKNNDPRTRKIKDIAGLCDGQTIHLVKKRDTGNSNDSSSSGSSSGSNNSGRSSSIEAAAAASDMFNGSSAGGSGGSGGGAFLAALLGLGNLTDDGFGTNGGTGNGNEATNNANATPTTSSWRSSRRSQGRPHYRLSAADLEVPDPGSMEPVRQGLMTLHTLLPHSELHRESETSPLEANREWFRGQWLDCRDTVNQWLEATVVEILRPQDILPLDAVAAPRPTNSSSERRRPTVDNDPAVSANDLEGRRRLLLEPCRPGDPQELSGDLAGYRPRGNNKGVQLLLIHYNGWPHRWDEWV